MPAGITPEDAKELHLKGSPVGISFEVQGNNTTALGKSYSDSVNTYIGAERARPTRKLGGSKPDGVLNSDLPDDLRGVEAKYVENWTESLYSPDLRRIFSYGAVRNTVNQALKYSDKYTAGVDWYTNSVDFVRAYSRKFKEADIENITFIIIPAVRITP